MQEKNVLLLIDDNPLLTGMYKTAFEKAGMSVLFAHDGKEGIQLAQEKKPDIVLLDLLMPGIDGLAVLRTLKNDASTKDIKVVILTIVPASEKAEEAKKLGAVDYICKPDLELHDIVKRVIAHMNP